MKAFATLISLFFVTAITSYGQYTLQGKVTGAAGNPISNAVIVLEATKDSTIIKTGISERAGNYMINAAGIANTIIKASAAEYEEQRIPITDTSLFVIAINFSLTIRSKALNEVSVTTLKPLFERKTDRTIFNVENSITSIGGNAVDAIKKAPGVLVKEQDNSISLAGKSSVQVLINGRLTQLSGEDLIAYLQSISSDNIARIEVITTPPAQFDAAGNSGLINIVLKKNRKVGFNGDVRAGYEQSGYGTAIGGGNVNYRRGALNVYANVSYSDGAKRIAERLSTDFGDKWYALTDLYKRKNTVLQYTAGADYAINKKSTIGIQYTGSTLKKKYDEPRSDISIVDKGSNTVDSVIRTSAIANVRNAKNIINVNYEWNIDTNGKKLTVNANHLWFENGRDRDYDTQSYYGIFTAPQGAMTRNRNTGAQQINITTAQADLELPFKWAALSLGGKVSFTENSSGNNFLYFDNGAYIDDPAVSNEFHYSEQIQALYISGKRTFGKWDLQAGLRGEFTQTKGYSLKLIQSNANRYFNVFPTAYLQYKVNDDHVLNLNYSKRINRPGYRALDPYRSYSSPYSYIEGNPFLKPAFTHTVELGYTLKSKYSFSAFYQYEPNTFGQVFYTDSVHRTTYVRNENYGNSIYCGLNSTASFKPASFWDMQAQLSGFLQQINTTYTTQSMTGKLLPSYNIILNNDLQLNKSKTLFAALNIFYIGSYYNDLLKVQPQCNLDAGVKALLLDKKLILSLNANDVLRTMKVRGENIITGQMLDSYFDERNVRLVMTYKFGNKAVKGARERRTGIEEEKGRM